jgi:hypothetical protein
VTDRHRWGWRRRLAQIGAAIGVALLLVVVYGVAVEPRMFLDVREETAVVPGLPEAWEGQRVAMLSDLQIGLWLDNPGMVRRAVDEAIDRAPAVALIGGDLIYGEADATTDARVAVELLRPLVEAGIPTVAVLGNHDYDAEAVPVLVDELRAAGVGVLRNEALPLTPPTGEAPDATVWVVGIGPHLPDRDRPGEALAEVPDGAPRIVMMHNPATFEALSARSAPFGVAGHTHGGQLRIPFTPEWSYLSLVQGGPEAVDGWIDGYGAEGNRLYVNRGIGMSLIPMRINAAPELTVFELTGG